MRANLKHRSLLTEFGIPQRLESCEERYLDDIGDEEREAEESSTFPMTISRMGVCADLVLAADPAILK